jgi:hypothetical protein
MTWLFCIGRLGVSRERRAVIEGWRHLWWRFWWRVEHVTLVQVPRDTWASTGARDVFAAPPVLHYALAPDYSIVCGVSRRQPFTIDIDAVTCPVCRFQGERLMVAWIIGNR